MLSSTITYYKASELLLNSEEFGMRLVAYYFSTFYVCLTHWSKLNFFLK